MATGLTGAPIHTGSWGTPDFGLTEKLQSILNPQASYTAQGGSNLYGPSQTLGVSTAQSGTGNADQLWNEGWNAGFNSGGKPYAGGDPNYSAGYSTGWGEYLKRNPSGGGGGGGGGTPALVNDPGQPTQPTQSEDELRRQTTQSEDELRRQIESIYGPNAEYLNQAESNLNANYPSTTQAIEGQYTGAKNSLDLQNQQAQNALTGSETQATRQREDALTAATRLYNELQMGGRQRFGGSSSAGEAYGALTAVEQQRRQGAIQTSFGDTMTNISQKRVEVAQQFTNTLYTLETEKQNAINQAKQSYDDKVLEIMRLRSQNEATKQSAVYDALVQLKSQIFAINQQNAQFTQQINAQKTAYDQQLDQVAVFNQQQQQQAQTYVNDYATQATTNPTTSMSITEPNQPMAYSQTGIKRPKDEFDYNYFS